MYFLYVQRQDKGNIYVLYTQHHDKQMLLDYVKKWTKKGRGWYITKNGDGIVVEKVVA